MYPNLKLQIFKSGLHQNYLAKQIGIPDTILSKIIHGHRPPTDQQRHLIASYLQADEEWLFQEFNIEVRTSISPKAVTASRELHDDDSTA